MRCVELGGPRRVVDDDGPSFAQLHGLPIPALDEPPGTNSRTRVGHVSVEFVKARDVGDCSTNQTAGRTSTSFDVLRTPVHHEAQYIRHRVPVLEVKTPADDEKTAHHSVPGQDSRGTFSGITVTE